MLTRFPYKCSVHRKVDLLKLKDEDFPYAIAGDYLRDENGEIMQKAPEDIKPSSPVSERYVDVDIMYSDCDITEASKSSNAVALGSVYVISLPFIDNLVIERGDSFVSEAFGLRINGEISAIFPSQLGVKLYISDSDN